MQIAISGPRGKSMGGRVDLGVRRLHGQDHRRLKLDLEDIVSMRWVE